MENRMSVAALAVCAVANGQAAFSQDISGVNGDLIGTVTIGDSLRGVVTDTAAPETTIDQEELDARQATTLGRALFRAGRLEECERVLSPVVAPPAAPTAATTTSPPWCATATCR